jgi:hypothetical protein
MIRIPETAPTRIFSIKLGNKMGQTFSQPQMKRSMRPKKPAERRM